MESYQAHVRSISSRCVHNWIECVCVCVCGMLVYCAFVVYMYVCICVCLYGFLYASGSCLCCFKRCVSSNCLCVPFMCMMLLTLTVDCWCWLEILQQQQRRQRPQKIQTLDVYAVRLQNRFLLSGEKEARERKNNQESYPFKTKNTNPVNKCCCLLLYKSESYISLLSSRLIQWHMHRSLLYHVLLLFFCSLDLISTMIEQISFQWINHFFFSAKRFNPNNFMWHARQILIISNQFRISLRTFGFFLFCRILYSP